MPVNLHCQQTRKIFKRKAFEGKEKFFSSFLLSPSLAPLFPFFCFSFFLFQKRLHLFFPVHNRMTNTKGYGFQKIYNVLANSWWRGIERNCGVGWCKHKQGEHQAIHICLAHSKSYMSEYGHEAGWWTEENNFVKELIRMWGLSGAWAALQPPSRQRSISADMMSWHACVPSGFAQPHSPRGPGSLAWLQGSQQFAGFFGAMAVVTFRNGLHGGHCWRCHRVPPYQGFLNRMGRNQRKFPTDCLYSPASKRRVRFGVENVAQDECKPKKPHLFHGSSLYPQSQEIILLTEKTY